MIKNRTIDGYAYLLCYCPGRIYIARGPWHFGDFLQHLPAKHKGRPKIKVLPSERRAPGTVPYGKSRPGYCITFLERLDESPR